MFIEYFIVLSSLLNIAIIFLCWFDQVRIGSVAAEDNKIQVGDVLTHVDGQFVGAQSEK